ncbi:tetratricopeptide repeat protein [Mycobacterium sp. 050128]|uniref:tetratricopeptide repeat protein n=1 Tax=Mycobacterium sp. 050128 TaxID=3096112 RepID=UPI002ED926DE
MAMAFVRAIEESMPGSDARDIDWWTRTGRRLIRPFVDKDVATNVLRAVVSYPGRVDDARQTFIAALEATGQDFYQLAVELDFDAPQFLSALPDIVLDELVLAAAEQNSPLLQLAQYATLRQIATKQDAASAPPESEVLADLVEVVDGDDLPMVAGLDPYRLGATPSPFGDAQTYGEHDPYVPRTRDNDLATALADRNQLVLLVGPSKAGKTRTAFEAVRKHFPQARLLFPRPGMFGRLVADPRLHNSPDTVVVWLDDLDRYVSDADPLTPALLSRLNSRSGRTVVLATLRQEQRDRLYQGGALLRDTRVLLEHAITVDLAPLTGEDPDEQAAAGRAYPGQDLEFGLAARLAGAPELLKRYDDALYTDPLRHSVIRVAIDWVRVGRPDLIPESALAALALGAFETERPDLDATEQQAVDAIKAARTPQEGWGRVAALITRRLTDHTRSYRPFDYLVAADDGQNHPLRPIPESFWNVALNNAPPIIALVVSLAAFQRENIPVAIKASRQAAAAGLGAAMFSLGLLLADHQDPEDLPGARRWYEKAAAAGNTDAMVNLGVLLATRWDPPDLDAARRLYERAAATGDTDAMVNLGVLFADLQDPPNLTLASRWYLLAAAAGNTNAMNNLGVLFAERNDLNAERSWYEKAADAGNAGAMINLGLLAEREDPPDLETANDWYQKAADAGNTDAMVNLGVFLVAEGDSRAARRWYENAAHLGNTRAMVNLAMLLAEQDDSSSLNAAFEWLTKAANAGDIYAMNNLGLLLIHRMNPPEPAAGRAWLKKAADRDDADAMVSLGLLAAQENPPDLTTASNWYKKAADAGHAGAMFNLGLLAEQANPPHLETAHAWYQKAAGTGETNAMVNLGGLATHSNPPDLLAARHWYETAAELGNTTAMINLGVLFADLQDTPDLPAARHWYETAAKLGNTTAMVNLAMLLAGRWKPPDPDAARGWLAKAAAAGHSLDELLKPEP